nr:MAG: hypothetical protein [Microvirus Sku121]
MKYFIYGFKDNEINDTFGYTLMPEIGDEKNLVNSMCEQLKKFRENVKTKELFGEYSRYSIVKVGEFDSSDKFAELYDCSNIEVLNDEIV